MADARGDDVVKILSDNLRLAFARVDSSFAVMATLIVLSLVWALPAARCASEAVEGAAAASSEAVSAASAPAASAASAATASPHTDVVVEGKVVVLGATASSAAASTATASTASTATESAASAPEALRKRKVLECMIEFGDKEAELPLIGLKTRRGAALLIALILEVVFTFRAANVVRRARKLSERLRLLSPNVQEAQLTTPTIVNSSAAFHTSVALAAGFFAALAFALSGEPARQYMKGIVGFSQSFGGAVVTSLVFWIIPTAVLLKAFSAWHKPYPPAIEMPPLESGAPPVPDR